MTKTATAASAAKTHVIGSIGAPRYELVGPIGRVTPDADDPPPAARATDDGGSLDAWVGSDADALGEQLAVVREITEEELGALGPLEVQVSRVLPREADAT